MTRPWISTNLAVSADGKISSVNHCASGWTSREDHSRLLELRRAADALLVGRGTLETDNMTLTVPGKTVQPLRCIVSRRGIWNSSHPLFHTPGGPIHLLVTGSPAAGAPPGSVLHHGELEEFLEILTSRHGVRHLHCEGGGGVIRALAEIDAIDEFHLTLAGHTIFGGQNAPTATGIPGNFMPNSLEFEMSDFSPQPGAGECFLTYRRKGRTPQCPAESSA